MWMVQVMSGSTRFGRLLGVFAVASALLGGLWGTPVSANTSSTVVDQFANIDLPGELGQTGSDVWVPDTGHSIGGYMLDYWRANGAASVFGNPISEPFASENGRYSQAFEGGVFEFYPELVWTDAPSVSLMPVADVVLDARLGGFRRDGKRDAGGGDRQSDSWRDVPANSPSATTAVQKGEIYDQATAQTISGTLHDWYVSHEGYAYLGSPVSEPVQERGGFVQYFEGGALMLSSSDDVSVLPVVAENADVLRIDTTPIEQNGLPQYDELYFWKAQNPNPLGDPYALGKKWIEVSISQQTLWAYQGDTVISSTYVSTGIEPNHTEQGVFHVRYKLESQDMAGATDADGNVVALGEGAAEAAESGQASGQTPYIVQDVPNVMYINMDAEAMHGAYWHNNFGNPMSHGCINLPVEFSDFLFGWAPLGTMVWVHA